VWNLRRSRPQIMPEERKRAILARMDLAELADIGLKPADVIAINTRR
jgi:uncharacterized protein YjiS (DUF1127 family)